jgi:hypothetical protein
MQPGASGEDGGAGAVPLQGHKGPGQQLHNVCTLYINSTYWAGVPSEIKEVLI